MFKCPTASFSSGECSKVFKLFKMFGYKRHQNPKFNSIIYNSGGHYLTSSATFVCPWNGVYGFFFRYMFKNVQKVLDPLINQHHPQLQKLLDHERATFVCLLNSVYGFLFRKVVYVCFNSTIFNSGSHYSSSNAIFCGTASMAFS